MVTAEWEAVYMVAQTGIGVESLRGIRVIRARSLDVGQTVEALLQISAAAGYSAVATGASSHRLTRAYRPRWATAAAIVGSVLFGLGLLFLRVERTETADASVVDENGVVELWVIGTLGARCLAVLENCLEQGGDGQREDLALRTWPRCSPVGSAAVSVGSGFGPQRVSPPPLWIPEAVAAGSTPWHGSGRTESAAQLRAMRRQIQSQDVSCLLHFASGEVVAADRGAVIGRDPAPTEELPGAARIAFADASLSRSHLVVGPSARGVWITDRHSTNGSSVLVHGTFMTCRPGIRVEVPVGGTVLFGDRSFIVEAMA
jgi:hypothetical protein